MRTPPEDTRFTGAAGVIEAVVEHPEGTPRAMALVAHPHPLYGGSLDNKVAQTVARAFVELGCIAVRTNFRGVGETAGTHDHGVGEADDLIAVVAQMRERFGSLPLMLAGYSFGAYVQTRVAAREAPAWLVLVAAAAGKVGGGRAYDTGPVPEGTLVIHGDVDETVPLANVLAWAAPQELPVVVLAGCDHFFRRKLHVIRGVIRRAFPG